MSSNMTPNEAKEWMLGQLKTKASQDIYTARSWLLTAKSMFPMCFDILYETYKLEGAENNVKERAALLSEMFQQFPHEPFLRNEIESTILLIDSSQEDQALHSKMFESITPDLQKRMLAYCIENQTDIIVRCKMTLVLIQRYPGVIVQYGIPLADRLVNEEKMQGSSSPINQYRKLLVCDVLPVLCQKIVSGVSPKQFYKWLQKAAEFYAIYFTSSTKKLTDTIGKLNTSWDDLEFLRKFVMLQCDWDSPPESHPTMFDKINHIKDLHRRSRVDVTGRVNKKQIFYTAVLLLFEAAVKYMELLHPKFYEEDVSLSALYVNVFRWDSANAEDCSSSIFAAELHKCFQVAATAWDILHSNDAYSKDLNHLYRRWKMDSWTWFQLFLVDRFAFERKYENAISRLQKILDQDTSELPRNMIVRCICQLSSCHYATGQLFSACETAIECLQKLPDVPLQKRIAYEDPLSFSDDPSNNSLVLMPLSFSNLLPFWVHMFITSLAKIVETVDSDEALGHLLVLSQQGWPKWQKVCLRALEIISQKTKFIYHAFVGNVIITDILEEIALLRNSSSCELVLLPGAPSGQQRITRGVNRNASEDYKIVMKAQINRSEDCLDDVIKQFFIEQQKSLLNCLQLEEMV